MIEFKLTWEEYKKLYLFLIKADCYIHERKLEVLMSGEECEDTVAYWDNEREKCSAIRNKLRDQTHQYIEKEL